VERSGGALPGRRYQIVVRGASLLGLFFTPVFYVVVRRVSPRGEIAYGATR